MEQQVVTSGIFGLGSFWAAAAAANLGVVILGGLLGGLLQPVVAKLNPKSEDPTAQSYLLSPILGVAAAGISIYVLANSNPNDSLRLLFFALLCGLAFPAILASAVDNMTRRTTYVQQEVVGIAGRAKAEGIKETVQAAQDLRQVLGRNSADTVKPEGREVIDTVAQQAVNNIAQTPAPTAGAERQVIEELQAVGAVAQSSGWSGAAGTVVEQLMRLSETMEDKTAKASAEQAAQRLTSCAPFV